MEVIQKHLDLSVTTSVAFHKETVDMASEFYGDMIKKLVTFHTRMYNRYIEDKVPMLSHQLFALQGAFTGLFNAWKSTDRMSEEVHCGELGLLMNDVKNRLRIDDCLITKFKAQCSENQEWNEKVARTRQAMIDEFEKASQYKEIARRESRERWMVIQKCRDNWEQQKYKKQLDEEANIDINIAIKDGVQKGSFEEHFIKCLERSRGEFSDFLDFRLTDISKSFESSAQTCRKAIDHCLQTNCPKSSEFIQEIIDSGQSQIKNFEKAAKSYLETLSETLQRTLQRSRSISSQNVNVKFADAMRLKLEKTMTSLREKIDTEIKSLCNYRIEKRKEIQNMHAAEIAEHERSQIEGTQQDMFGITMNLDLKEYESTRRVIASGGEGTVFRYNLPAVSFDLVGQDLITVAAKKFEKLSSSIMPNKTKYVVYGGTEEILTLCRLRHANVARFLGTGLLAGERYLLMEFYPRNIAEEIDNCRKATRDKHKFLKLAKFTRWADEIAHALRYVHGNDLIHGDLKPRNILLNLNDVVKLADFGLSSVPILKQGMLGSNRGTKQYMAPEQHAGEKLDLEKLKLCDVWSYGIVLWEMITCREPFAEVPEHLIPIIIKENTEASHPPLPSECIGESLINVLMACWNPTNIYRFSMYTIYTQFLTDVITEFQEEFSKESLWIEECQKWAAAAQVISEKHIKQRNQVKLIGPLDSGERTLQTMTRIRTILDDVAPSTIEHITNEFLSFRVHELTMNDDIEMIMDVVNDIFKAADQRPENAHLYARLCAAQVASELAEKEDSKFRAALREQILGMERFGNAYDEVVDEMERNKLTVPDLDRKEKMNNEIAEFKIRNRNRKFAHIRFLGQLFLHDVIPSRDLYPLVMELLNSITNEEQEQEDVSIVCALQLLELCGERLQAEISATEQPGRPPSFDLEATFDILTAALPRVSERVRELIERLLALRSNGWKRQEPSNSEMYNDIEKEWLYNNGSDDEEKGWEQVRDLDEKDV